MSVSRLVKILILSLALVNVVMAAQTPAQIEKDIGNKVYCLCGCVTTLNHCPMLHCAEKEETRAVIRADLKKGMSEPAILQDLVNRYGERVLAAPPARGFNLTAWVLPGIGLLIGLFLAITIVRRWHRPAVQGAAPAEPTEPVDNNLRSAVEEEMKKYMD
jgi:cytochrome c-type biogenesis protein CcmH